MKKTISLSVIGIFILSGLAAQNVSVPQIGVKAPAFKAKSTVGEINFPADYAGKWKILFSHPKDFTPVCSSEILDLASEQARFKELDVQLLVISTDLVEQHNSWKTALEEIEYMGSPRVKIDFPLLADYDHKISRLYGMMHTSTSPEMDIRGVFFIDPDNTIRAIQFYPIEVGRSTSELIRTLQALQKTYAQTNLATPVNWMPGDDVIVPVLTDEEKAGLGKPGSPYYQKSWFMTYKKTI